MRATAPSILALLALSAPGIAATGSYRCTAHGAPAATHLLEHDRSGGSMGNPAQRSAYRLAENGSGRDLMRCPRGFRSDRVHCTRATPGPPAGRFEFDRGRNACVLALDAHASAPARREAGRCAADNGDGR